MSDTRSIREQAAQIIERGWWNGVGHPGQSRCLLMAIMAASTNVPEMEATIDVVKADLGRSSLTRWNDAEGRTQADVLAALRGRQDHAR